MSTEITRAGHADRARYDEHLPYLVVHGFIDEDEVPGLHDRIMRATHTADLDRILDGLPKPAPPPVTGIDWGIPRNFIPVSLLMAYTGVLVGGSVPLALSGRHGALAGLATMLSVSTGVLIVVAALFFILCSATRWDELGSEQKRQRRDQDERRRR